MLGLFKVLHGFTRKVIHEKRVELDSSESEELPKGQRVAFLDLILRVKQADGTVIN